MKNTLLLMCLLLLFTCIAAQGTKITPPSSSTCELVAISKNFNYTTKIFWTENEFDLPFAERMEVQITGKNDGGSSQFVEIESTFMAVLFDSFSCINVRSYFTDVNIDEPIIDNNCGNFVVRDFNFDGLEDFEIKVADNNVGSLYAYYVQANGKFKREDYLSDNVGLMIDSFNLSTKQGYRSAAAGCCKMIHYTYQYNETDCKWALVKTEEEDLSGE